MRHVLPVQIDAAWLGVDASAVEEILQMSSGLPLPGTRPEIPGVLPWRGRAVAVLDMAGLSAGTSRLTFETSRTRVVVARAGEHTVALPVHGVREVLSLPAESIEDPPPGSPDYVVGQAVLPAERLALVDLAIFLFCVGTA
jgi:chemotaxis signal transduction protein